MDSGNDEPAAPIVNSIDEICLPKLVRREKAQVLGPQPYFFDEMRVKAFKVKPKDYPKHELVAKETQISTSYSSVFQFEFERENF